MSHFVSVRELYELIQSPQKIELDSLDYIELQG